MDPLPALPASPSPAAIRSPLAPAGASREALWAAARRFEAQALSALLAPVFGEAPRDGLVSGGAAERQWRPMLVEQHARAWAERGGVGIASAVFTELLRTQGHTGPDGGPR